MIDLDHYTWREPVTIDGQPRLIVPWSDPRVYEWAADMLFATVAEADEWKAEYAADEDDWVLVHYVGTVADHPDVTHHAVKDARSVVAHWWNDKIDNLFSAEITNERNGGHSPATLDSAIDSVSQAPDIMCPDWTPDDWAALLMLVTQFGADTELRVLARLR